MEEKKRRGYKTQEQQNEATKRYLANNPEAKKKSYISSIRGGAKRFIREFSTLEELQELKELINIREKELKS